MPDGDIPPRLRRQFYRVFGMLFDKDVQTSDFGYLVLRSLKKRIQFYGNPSIELIIQAGDYIRNNCPKTLGDDRERIRTKIRIDQIASNVIFTKRRARDLALRACKEGIEQMYQYGFPSKPAFEFAKGYMWNVYDADFSSLIPISERYQSSDQDFANERLADIVPIMRNGISRFSGQVLRRGDVKDLRLPPRPRPHIDLHTPL